MWYSGRAGNGPALDSVAPSSGATGEGSVRRNAMRWHPRLQYNRALSLCIPSVPLPALLLI